MSLLFDHANYENYVRLAVALDYALTYMVQPSEEWVHACRRSREEARADLQRVMGNVKTIQTTSQICTYTDAHLRLYQDTTHYSDLRHQPEEARLLGETAFSALRSLVPSLHVTACIWVNHELVTVTPLFLPYNSSYEECCAAVSRSTDIDGRVVLYIDETLTVRSDTPIQDLNATLYVGIEPKN